MDTSSKCPKCGLFPHETPYPWCSEITIPPRPTQEELDRRERQIERGLTIRRITFSSLSIGFAILTVCLFSAWSILTALLSLFFFGCYKAVGWFLII